MSLLHTFLNPVVVVVSDATCQQSVRETPTCRCVTTATSITARTAPAEPLSTCRSQQRVCHHLVRELQLWNTTVFCTSGPPALSARNEREDSLVQELDESTSTTCTTGTSTARPPRHRRRNPPPPYRSTSEPIGLLRPKKSSQPVPPPQSHNLALRGAPSPCCGGARRRSR